jgi:hypothetical protein
MYRSKPLKNRNNEIIVQYLTNSTVIKDEPPVMRLVGVSNCPWMSDQLSNKCQKCPKMKSNWVGSILKNIALVLLQYWDTL